MNVGKPHAESPRFLVPYRNGSHRNRIPSYDSDLLEQSFDYVIAVLPQITPEQLHRTWNIPPWRGRTDPDGRAMMMNMLVHTAHHRAQCEVYLRVKGIKLPDYRF
ncbi:MAG TPA: hypothetical protein VG498_19015 [Terriglobales bacterium]|nr:hypothetical protein [Terriglobales bacterium]